MSCYDVSKLQSHSWNLWAILSAIWITPEMYGQLWVSFCIEDIDKLEASRGEWIGHGVDRPPCHIEHSPRVWILWKKGFNLLAGISKEHIWRNAGMHWDQKHEDRELWGTWLQGWAGIRAWILSVMIGILVLRVVGSQWRSVYGTDLLRCVFKDREEAMWKIAPEGARLEARRAIGGWHSVWARKEETSGSSFGLMRGSVGCMGCPSLSEALAVAHRGYCASAVDRMGTVRGAAVQRTATMWEPTSPFLGPRGFWEGQLDRFTGEQGVSCSWVSVGRKKKKNQNSYFYRHIIKRDWNSFQESLWGSGSGLYTVFTCWRPWRPRPVKYT